METSTRLPSEIFLKLTDTFQDKGWEIPENDDDTDNRFYRFCKRLSILDINEQELIIDLTKKYLTIGGQDYIPFLTKLLDQINLKSTPLFTKTKQFYISPLIAPKDLQRTKSSSSVWYNFQDEHIRLHQIFKSKRLFYYDPTQFSKFKELKSNEAIILLDDYVGSGETAIDTIEWICNDFGVNQNQIIILTIAAQKQGINSILEKYNVNFFSYFVLEKGISDTYKGAELDKRIETMKNIEKKLKVKNKFKFGYNRSEALISLIKTPNNTFPIFWMNNEKNEFAPFLRY